MNITNFLGYARKFTVALGAALAVAVTAFADGSVTGPEWLGITLAFLGALGVYVVPNNQITK